MTHPEDWFPWIEVAAFVAGLIFGGLAIGSPSWVWLKRQLLTVPAFELACLGTTLIGMSVWKSVQIEGPGFKAIIAELNSTKQQVAALSDDVNAVQSIVALGGIANRGETVDLTDFRALRPTSMAVLIANDIQRVENAMIAQGVPEADASRIARDIVQEVLHGSALVDTAPVSTANLVNLKDALIKRGHTDEQIEAAIRALRHSTIDDLKHDLQDASGLRGSG